MGKKVSCQRLRWRKPTRRELEKLAKFYSQEEEYFFENEQEALKELKSRAQKGHILVCSNYVSDGYGYSGKLYFVVFGDPHSYGFFIERIDGSLEKVKEES